MKQKGTDETTIISLVGQRALFIWRSPIWRMNVTFLGTGGGRFVTSQQLLGTGGFVIELDGERLHIDPGPGALVRAKQYGVRLSTLTGVLVSHSHTDHCTDAAPVIEAMTRGTVRKRGVLLGSTTVFDGSPDGEFRPAVSVFHIRCVEKAVKMSAGDTAAVGKLTVTATPTRHTEPCAIGFLIEGSSRVGYTSDTEYFPELGKIFAGCDLLIINCQQPRSRAFPKYMNTAGAGRLIAAARPRQVIIQHFGHFMLATGPEKEAAWLEKKTGMDIMVAQDGKQYAFRPKKKK